MPPASPAHPSPFGQLSSDLSEGELRETAYEIFVGACRSTGSKPLTFVSSHSSSPPRHHDTSLTSAAANKVKKALGIKKKPDPEIAVARKGPRAVADLMRVQMGISEQADARIRRGLLRIAAGQLGRGIESMVLPIEFLQQFKASDFSDQQEYEAWQTRNLKVLEAGLLMHPHLPLNKYDDSYREVQGIIHKALKLPLEIGKGSESLQILRNGVMSLARRSFDGSTLETYHWADGSPLNLYLYQMLLEACFDNNGGYMLEETDEMLESIKKTWVVLGMNQALHNLCVTWILFHQFSLNGYRDDSLLLAVDSQMTEVARDSKPTKDPVYSRILHASLSSILGWAERQLFAYHEVFHSKNLDLMECVVSLAVSAAKVLDEGETPEHNKTEEETIALSACQRIDTYIHSSLRAAFTQRMEKARYRRCKEEGSDVQTPILSTIAHDTGELARKEKELFNPVLKKWHPLAMGVAVATLHRCYGDVLKEFTAGVTELTLDSVEVLLVSNKLEKYLVEIAVDASIDSEDGGKAIIQDMPPYEAESILSNLGKTWIKTRVVRLDEWIHRNLQLEPWKPNANRMNAAPSAIEVLRLVDDTLEAFFELSVPTHAALVPDLIVELDESICHYISAVKSGCGSRNTYFPALPTLTRCSVSTKFRTWKKKEKPADIQKKKPYDGAIGWEVSTSLPELCIRLNTINYIRTSLESLEKRTNGTMKKSDTSHSAPSILSDCKFTSSISMSQEGIRELCEAMAYRTVFWDLRGVLWDGLYVGGVESSRIEPMLQHLDPILEIMSNSIQDKLRNRAITATMKACFEGFLLVLLAGGPSRAFTCQDSQILEEDFHYLMELFLADGDGIPQEVVDKAAIPIRSIFPLFREDSASLIEKFKQMVMDASDPASKSKLPLPPTNGRWSPTDPNTILRVLCYRNDEVASKFLKKSYHLPKRL